MFTAYLHEVAALYRAGKATEHSYRSALQVCLTRLLKDVQVTNEPKRQRCGAPDYILTRRKIDIGYIEAKDIGVDLDRVERGGKDDDQWKRYTESLDNIVLTDYIEFRFFLNGQKVETIRIAEIIDGGLAAKPENFARLQALFMDFAAFQGQTIKSARKLAEMMARKSALMRDVFFKAVTDESAGESSLKDQLTAFQTVLMHDMDAAQFADVYAQTIAYGLFTARLHDETVADFSRAEALTLIPKSNPFLRQLFHYVAGPDLDDRVVWIVDALCEVYRAADLQAILKDFGVSTGQSDPMLHFYETFLAAYDPTLRKARGVWYTPEPVVQFIVRAIDDVLKDQFGLKDGLAHTGMVEIEVDAHAKGKTTKIKQQVHKVQLLDVATGTGTFLAEVVKQLYARFKGQEGMWSGYVERHLLPRLHGFELLMASYAMCHMKLDLLLNETGYRPSKSANPPRLSVYLTNSLEEHHPDTGTLFANWLSREANEASRIKKDMPIMVAFGNPPYSGHSSNNGAWIQGLLDAYKKEPGGKQKLQEKNGKWLNDDYVKFIRLGEYYVEKNGEGVLAYITNHSYLDNPTFRGMRWHLLHTFDEIFILDLHGNAKKKETAPDGSADKNVFDIQQGVAIIVAVKKTATGAKSKALAKVHHKDVWGNRDSKYAYLQKQRLNGIDFQVVRPSAPLFMLLPRDERLLAEYQAWPRVSEIMKTNVLGFQSHRDDFAVDFERDTMRRRIEDLRNDSLTDDELRRKYGLADNRDWQLEKARKDVKADPDWTLPIIECAYRPFDNRACYFSYAAMDYPRRELLQHVVGRDNLCLHVVRQTKAISWQHAIATKLVAPAVFVEIKDGSNVFPLYLYENVLGDVEERRPNLDPKIYKALQKIVPDLQPQSLFDYIYAVLHSRAYRRRYAEFLKSDFPRIPYPNGKKVFHALAAQGGALRELHLMQSPALDTLITTYPIGGDHEVVAPRWEESKDKPGLGRVWINPTQHFDHVPLIAWTFYIGGYQPAQKWLKDRKGRRLSSDDLRHWQRLIVALTHTDKIMTAIDQTPFLPPLQGEEP